MSSVEIFQEPDGRWRWSFSNGRVDLKSNRTYEDADSATRAARMAYPEHFHVHAAKAVGSGGLVSKIARLLALVLLVVAWRRSNKPH